MKTNLHRIQALLYDIKRNSLELESLLSRNEDYSILKDQIILKAIKYIIIEIAEAIANILQHILARGMGRPVAGYLDTLLKAKENGIISSQLFLTLKPFFEFRNALVHRYWNIDDNLFLKNLRSGYKDFQVFVEEIEKQIEKDRLKTP